MEVEIQALQAGEERRGSSAWQSNGCCFDPAVLEQVFAFGAETFIHFLQQQAVHSKEQEQKRKKLGKETGMMRRRRMSGMKVMRWLLLWILIGVKMRMVEAAEEISARQEMVLRSETPVLPRLQEESRAKWKRRNASERGWRVGKIGNQEEESKNSQGVDPRTCEKTAREGTLAPLK